MIRERFRDSDYPDSVRWVNGSGRPLESWFKLRGWRSIRRTVGYDWAQVNHYAVKSMDAYALRKLRGNVNLKANKYNTDYWSLQDRNEVEDTRISRHRARRDEIIAALLEDPTVRRLHEAAIARVEARLASHKATDAYREMVESLVAASAVPITQVVATPPKPRDREAARRGVPEAEAAGVGHEGGVERLGDGRRDREAELAGDEHIQLDQGPAAGKVCAQGAIPLPLGREIAPEVRVQSRIVTQPHLVTEGLVPTLGPEVGVVGGEAVER
jgi:hypothetical protein